MPGKNSHPIKYDPDPKIKKIKKTKKVGTKL